MIDRRRFIQTGFAAAAASTVPATAHARAPMAQRNGSTFHRFKVGDFEITALSDGAIGVPVALTTRLDPARHRALLADQMKPDPVPTSVNVFLVNTGSQLALIDAGAAASMGPGLGQLQANLAAAGIKPEDIDLIALTHVHPDHSNGLIRADGKAAFPNAELVVGQADAAFWLNEANAGQIAKDFSPFFGMAKTALAPYATRTRTIAAGDVMTGVTAIAAPGHTPGHTVFRISSGQKQLLILGDTVHSPATQFIHPEAAVAFDVDQDTAVASRRRLFDLAAADRIPVVGMHLDFPGVGYIQRKDSAFSFTATPWQETF
jgi:glyoxylase-like metal-dependent hydrolase (beta-lactamase superfamily II)